MNILTILQQLLGSGCSGGSCPGTAAQAAPNLIATLCRLFGLGC